ncbi:unnamed protein product [Alopecurus aequalis]
MKPSPAARMVALALLYVCLAIGWVSTAGMTATIVARRACREGSALLVFLEAFTDAAAKFYMCTIFIFLALAAVLLFGMCLAYLVALVSGSGSEFKKSAFGATTQKPIPTLLRAVVLEFVADLPGAVVLGVVADLALILLTAAGTLVGVMSPHVEGSMSQGQRIGSVIVDVGVVGMGAISCFAIYPGLALFFWRMEQAVRKSELTVRIVEAQP